MTPNAAFDFDAAVIGAGPAGCAAAIELAARGRSVVLFERERFPRFHIGESLLSTVNDCLETLGVAEAVAAERFPVKWGATLLSHDGAAGRTVDFAASREIARPQTWQVCRERFDALLLARAREAGVEVREGTRVEGCAFDAGGATVHAAEAGARVRAVVDASGRWGVLSRALGLRRAEPSLGGVAIYAHYSGVPPLGDGREGDLRIVAREDAGWFWLIPIGDGLTSVGAVVPKTLYDRLAKGSPEGMLAGLVAETPAVAELMRDAERAWPVRVEQDFSYGAAAFAGDRWLLAGDAGAFLDPVFSTGVSIALESGIEAARALDRALADGRFGRRRFRSFEALQRRRYRRFRRFVTAFYTPWFRDLFFQPTAPAPLFRAVVTVLAGNWRPSWRTRALLALFFALVRAQRTFDLVPRIARRDLAAGFPAAGGRS